MKVSSRNARCNKRNLAKVNKELGLVRQKLAEKNRKAILFQKMVIKKKSEYEKRLNTAERDNSILRQSLRNFAASYYTQKKELFMLKKHSKSRKRRHFKTRAC